MTDVVTGIERSLSDQIGTILFRWGILALFHQQGMRRGLHILREGRHACHQDIRLDPVFNSGDCSPKGGTVAVADIAKVPGWKLEAFQEDQIRVPRGVDDLTWEPGWVEVSNDEQRRRISEICARSEWILDTAYARWRDIPLSRAELIVALDYPRWVSLQRLLRRTAVRCWTRTPICNGNTESLRTSFGREP